MTLSTGIVAAFVHISFFVLFMTAAGLLLVIVIAVALIAYLVLHGKQRKPRGFDILSDGGGPPKSDGES